MPQWAGDSDPVQAPGRASRFALPKHAQVAQPPAARWRVSPGRRYQAVLRLASAPSPRPAIAGVIMTLPGIWPPVVFPTMRRATETCRPASRDWVAACRTHNRFCRESRSGYERVGVMDRAARQNLMVRRKRAYQIEYALYSVLECLFVISPVLR